jgi:hypothetical protein
MLKKVNLPGLGYLANPDLKGPGIGSRQMKLNELRAEASETLHRASLKIKRGDACHCFEQLVEV